MPATPRLLAATLAVAGALLASASAQAAPTSITYTSKFAVFHNTVTGELVSAQRVQDGSGTAFSLQAFDGSLGTLLAVDLTYNARWTYNASLMGHANIGGCGAACMRAPDDADIAVRGRSAALFALYLTGADGPLALWQRDVSADALGCAATAPARADCQSWSASQGSANGKADTGAMALARFVQGEGVQQIDFLARTLTSVDVQDCDLGSRQAVQHCQGQALGRLNGALSVTYTFEAAQQAVPLPSTLALLLAAGGLLAWQRRRAA